MGLNGLNLHKIAWIGRWIKPLVLKDRMISGSAYDKRSIDSDGAATFINFHKLIKVFYIINKQGFKLLWTLQFLKIK